MLCQEIHGGRVVLWSRGWRAKEEHQAPREVGREVLGGEGSRWRQRDKTEKMKGIFL